MGPVGLRKEGRWRERFREEVDMMGKKKMGDVQDIMLDVPF